MVCGVWKRCSEEICARWALSDPELGSAWIPGHREHNQLIPQLCLWDVLHVRLFVGIIFPLCCGWNSGTGECPTTTYLDMNLIKPLWPGFSSGDDSWCVFAQGALAGLWGSSISQDVFRSHMRGWQPHFFPVHFFSLTSGACS